MFDQLEGVVERYEEVGRQLMDPYVVSDNLRYRDLMKEHKRLTPIVEKYLEYKKAKADAEEARALLEEGGLDKDFREMVEAEYAENREKTERFAEELKILLLPSDPNDDKSVIIEIRGGAGGEESALFANSLMRMYTMYAESQGWKWEILSANPTELGGFKEVSFSIEGEGA